MAISLSTGDTLFAENADALLTPASNSKIPTTLAALHHLGPDFRYQTFVLADGLVAGGVLDGDLILFGTGDPSGSRRFAGRRSTDLLADYAEAHVTLWRGPLVGDTGTGAGFSCQFETSHDAEDWTRVTPALPGPPITSVNISSMEIIPVSRRWMRVSITLTEDTDDVVAITCWCTGLLERRVQ